MNTIDILLVITCIFVVYLLLNDYINLDDRIQHFKVKKLSKPVNSVKEIYKPKINIEKLEDYDYYPINFNLSRPLSYVPDDCLPLNFQYDSSANTILLNGSGQIVATDASLNTITSNSEIKLNLILSKSGESDIYMTISDIQFSITQCNSNPSITITNIPNKPETNLLSTFDSISGNIIIGLLTFSFNKITFDTTPTLATLFDQNPKNEDSTFAIQSVCSIESCNPTLINLAPIISAPLNAIEQLIEDKQIFALYAMVTKKGIPSNMYTDKNKYKVYLSVTLDPSGNSNLCGSSSGMLKFTNNLTQGSIFNASKEIRRFLKSDKPYKYLDFHNTEMNVIKKTTLIESKFYNLSLVKNNYSLTYCLSGCDQSNKNGFCAQENPKMNKNHQSKFTDDQYGIKNYMKFKFESDGSVTPYFLSMDNNEQIHFITNKYNSIDNDIGYKTLVQVPIYKDGAYYEIPDVVIQNSISFPIVKKVPILGLNATYTDQEITNFQESIAMSPEETKAFLNDAYNEYAMSFFIEEIDPKLININDLPLNEKN
jgi:hypothetical protein